MQMNTINLSDVSSEESQTAAVAPTWTKPSFESFPLNEAMASINPGAVDAAIFS